MTKAEQAALAEMDTTPERTAERQEHISQLLNGSDKLGEQLKASIALADGMRPPDAFPVTLKLRKKRSDAGVKKGPKIAQQPGKISAEQYERLNDLIITAEDRRKEYEVAADNEAKALAHLEAAIRERNNFIDELAGKGK